ncbi:MULTISPECIES: VOC family protein [unclassified Novosphingobium]|uniref:VOC family protein n=1 Tax=unclassified Novosphingobium TaxID=2644732 RepID=UPI00020EFC77|nr:MULTISPECIES: VOC family protein [unclassified Novosphingobium]BBA74105.1 glyoxalase/bleomycin resistance protein/dioxygenase [Novosphingobium sp. PY1]GFM31342.1 glyoxalase/bleomycin resistance protein/dioxygenase [Novosphingobium sp. PY1]CCA90472.1 glyoxalase/bleomycin resistance protein/dioxygenase [Novosphingobium sp. PP1Y]
MIRGVHHLAISTPDLERFIDHYRRWFGFERVGEGGWERGNARIDTMVGLENSAARYAMIRLGNLHIEVFEYASNDPREVYPRMCDHGITHLCLYCDDVFAEYERLKGMGMTFNCPPGGSGMTRATYGRDCDGNVVELLQIVDPDCTFAFEKQCATC